MSNNKQDSIEFLWNELKPFLPANYTVDESIKILSILKQAKAMHKEEIIYSVEVGYTNGYLNKEYDGHQHYNETFNNNEQH